jgi:hypothetical protein
MFGPLTDPKVKGLEQPVGEVLSQSEKLCKIAFWTGGGVEMSERPLSSSCWPASL